MNDYLSKHIKILNRRLSDYEFKRRKRFLFSRPWSVQLDVTTCCNLKCVMCFREQFYGKGRHMPLHMLRRLEKSVLRYCSHVLIGSSGESMLHPHFDELIHIISQTPFTYRKIITNASLMEEQISKQLVDLPMTEITISMDSCKPKTLRKIRCGLNTEQFMKNVTFLADYRRRKGTGPKLNINCVIMKPNLHEVPELVRFVAELGFHSIGFTTPFGFNEQSPYDIKSMLITPEDGKELRRVLEESRAVANDAGISFTFVTDRHDLKVPSRIFEDNQEQGYPPNQLPELSVDGTIREPFPSQQPNFRCEAPWVFTSIDPNGILRACCQTAWYELGSINKTSFINAWNSSRYKALRDGLAGRGMYSICHEKLCYYMPGSKKYNGHDSETPGKLEYRWIPEKTYFQVSAGDTLEIPVALENTGDTLWLSSLIHEVGAGRVNIALRYRKLPSPFQSFDELDRLHLPYDVLPGDRVFFETPFTVPDEPGEYELQFTMVDELIKWFDASDQVLSDSTVRISVT